MELFSNIKEAKRSEGGPYLGTGVHKLEINRVKKGKNWRKKNFFVVECKVLESTNEEEHAVGSSVDWYINMDGEYPDLSLGEVKHFLQVAIFASYALQDELYEGAEAPDAVPITEEVAEEACGEEQPFAGLILQAEGSRKEGKKYVKVNWSPAD
jgi:hypothetical protein